MRLRVASAASFMFQVFLLIDCWCFDFRQVTRIPELQLVSRVPALKYTIDPLCCSPQKKWVFLNKKHPHISPKGGPFQQLQLLGGRVKDGPALRED